jgi:hypothetical protein
MISAVDAASYLGLSLPCMTNGRVKNRSEPRRWEWMFTSYISVCYSAFSDRLSKHLSHCVFAGCLISTPETTLISLCTLIVYIRYLYFR